MPKLSKKPPKMGRDGDYAVVYLDGKKHFLGRWGSEEAKKNYRRFLMEWAALGYSPDVGSGKVCLIDELALAFLVWAKDNCGASDFGNYKTAIETALDVYSGTPVTDFGPKALSVVQSRFVQKGYARGHCNKLTSLIKTFFRWGVAHELVQPTQHDALKRVLPLRKGRSTAPESIPRSEVPDEVVRQTLPYLLPTIAAMVQVQRLAALRPSEVCNMKAGDIDRSKDIWLYQTDAHQNGWREHVRIIPLGKPEREIIAPRLVDKAPDEYVFSPKDTIAERRERDAARRKTRRQPSQVARSEYRAQNSRLRIRNHYDAWTYNQALKRVIESANKYLPDPKKIPHWTPYQLRHAAATEISETEGLDGARSALGQKTLSSTIVYDHSDTRKAIKIAEKRSKRLDDDMETPASR